MSTARPSFIQRIPQPLFTTGYGALLVGVVVSGVLLASHESDASAPPAAVERPLRPWLPPQTSQDNVDASVRPYLISDVETARSPTGVTLTGSMTPTAESDTTEFSGHVSRLLQQNCVDNMTVRTQDNLRVNFWGFCYSTLPPATIDSYLAHAMEDGAQEVSFSFTPGRPFERSVGLTWAEDTEDDASRVVDTWEDLPRGQDVDLLYLAAYGPETAYTAERTSKGYRERTAPAGQKFKEKYGVPTPAL
ncbi:hypothetical protein [uncultured Corynebacterium sp.]|uniref:hypothetical protein n=1 Tax=uncultured Corynebacterium sp. TaxID=159447 RepID=UPI00259A3C37|nr:hypothetical protein [uncultured Corynebacterium sp.]